MSRTSRNWLIGIAAAVLVVWLVKYASESEMRRLDKEVDRLCAIDGGIRIYETVKLPASSFNQFGQPAVPQGGKDDKRFGYFVRGESKTLAGPGQPPGARLLRDQTQVVRTEDGKVIAEIVIYTRGGGYWLEGVPGIGKGKNCPTLYRADFYQKVFIRE